MEYSPAHKPLPRRKAVSYVRFCSAAELVSASTDSTLRLWVRLPRWCLLNAGV